MALTPRAKKLLEAMKNAKIPADVAEKATRQSLEATLRETGLPKKPVRR